MKKDRVVWDMSTLSVFLDGVNTEHPYLAQAARLSLMTGLRAGELYALHLIDVDVGSRMMKIHRSYNHKTKSVQEHTKTGIVRYVPINEQLYNLLSAIGTKNSPYVLPRHPLFDHGNQSNALFAVCCKLGIPAIRWHDLRALYASRLLLSGVSMVGVMQICGWTQLSTAQRYLRLSGKDVVGLTDNVTFPG